MFLFREPYQNGKYMVQQTNKHPSELHHEIAFPKISSNISQKMFMVDRVTIKSQLKLLKQSPNIFLEHFQLFQSSLSVDLIQITFSDI